MSKVKSRLFDYLKQLKEDDEQENARINATIE